MKKLIIAGVVLAASASAFAQARANPFDKSVALPAAQPADPTGRMGQGGQQPSPQFTQGGSGATMNGAPRNIRDPRMDTRGGVRNGVNGGAPGFNGQPPYNGGTSMPSGMSQGMNQGYQPSPGQPFEDGIEEVPAVKLGVVNGKAIYRGDSVYLIEKEDPTTAVVRKAKRKSASAPQASTGGATGADQPGLNPGAQAGLPSTVGSPAPRKN